MDEQREQEWHLDKKVPISLIFKHAVQTAGIIWWARAQIAINFDHEQWIARLERDCDVIRVAERIAVMEAAVVDLQRSSERMEVMVQQALAERRVMGRWSIYATGSAPRD